MRHFLHFICLLFVGFWVCPSQAQSILLDDFNRSAANTLNTAALLWNEAESSGSNGSKVRLADITLTNQVLQMSGCNSDNSAAINGNEQVSMDVSNRYATVFNSASSTLEWYFNFRNPQSNPSGFGTSTYGIAFVLGCDESNFTSATADGYAVVIGNSSTPDPIRLVSFQNGLSVNSNLTTIINSGTTDDNNYYSVQVTFNPCTKQWSLAIRDDGSSGFSDPKTGSLGTALTAYQYTHTSLNLSYLGALWQHNAACGAARFDNFYIPTAQATANQYVWNGTSTDYQLATSWTPSRTCPLTSDVLVWNNASPSSSSVSNIPTDTVGQIVISGNREVTFRTPNAGGNKALSLSGGTGTDLQIGTGGSLIIDADTGLAVALLSGATATISGSVTFINTTNGSPRSHRLQAADAGAIVFQNGSVFTATDLSGNPFGNTGQTNTVIFQSGSTYVSQDGANPFGLAQPNSKVVFQSGSLYKLQQGIGFQLLGRTYGDVEINTPSIINNLFGGTGTVGALDNLNFVQGTLNFQLTSNNQPLNLIIKGDLTIQSGATLNFNPTNAAARSSLTFGGSSPQTIAGSGTAAFGTHTDIIFDNATGVTLNRNLILNGTLELKNGVVSTQTNELFLANPAVSSLLLSTSAFINGAFRRSVTASQLYPFPVGSTTHLQKALIQFSALDCVTDLTVRFRPTDPNTTPVTSFSESGVTFSHLLSDGYWEFTTNCGNAPASTYLLQLHPNQFAGYTQASQPFTIAKRVGTGNWQQSGSVHNPDGHVSFVQNDFSIRRTGMTGFSNFAVATTVTPLPVSWLHVSATNENGETYLNWITTAEKDNQGFEIQRSGDGNLFETIGFVAASDRGQSVNHYSFSVSSCGYYRLKQLDYNGQYAYSKIVSVTCEKPASQSPYVFPNPVSEQSTLVLPHLSPAMVRLLTLQGQLLGQWQDNPETMNGLLRLSLTKLTPGVYLLEVQQESTVWWLKIIKH